MRLIRATSRRRVLWMSVYWISLESSLGRSLDFVDTLFQHLSPERPMRFVGKTLSRSVSSRLRVRFKGRDFKGRHSGSISLAFRVRQPFLLLSRIIAFLSTAERQPCDFNPQHYPRLASLSPSRTSPHRDSSGRPCARKIIFCHLRSRTRNHALLHRRSRQLARV